MIIKYQEKLLGRRDELISQNAAAMQAIFGATPNIGLLQTVAVRWGPSIYRFDVTKEPETVKKNFLIKNPGK